MRISRAPVDITVEANADLSASQFTAVKFVAGPSGGVQARAALAAANERAIGVLQNKPNAAGVGAVVRIGGTTKLKVDGSGTAIVAGDALKADASSRGVKAATDKDKVIAIAMEPSSAANDVIEALISRYDIAV